MGAKRAIFRLDAVLFAAVIGASVLCPPIARHPRGYATLAIFAIFGSLLRSLNYNKNKASIEIGRSLQELVPANGYVFYCDREDLINPEFLYARRRGLLRDHHWDPDNTYLLANEVRLRPGVLES